MKDETPKTLSFSLYFGENQFPIVVRRMAGGGKPVPVHDHEFSELVIVTKGWVEHEIGGETSRLARGPDRLDDHPYSGIAARLPAKPLKEARALLEAMVRERREPGAGSSLFLGSLFSSVVILLARETVDIVPATRSDWRLGGVVNYMQCHLAERLRVDKLARLAAMSQSTLLRAFKEAFGCGPAKYFASLRLSRAAELFRTTNLTVGEVAWKTGFFDESHLRKKVAQELHTTIAALRGKAPKD